MASFALELALPDDFHHHLRDGDVLHEIVRHATRSFGRIIAMPNIKPPVRNLEEAQQYHTRIMTNVPADCPSFSALMTLYLTDFTTREEILRSAQSGMVIACKLYPAGATTNSEFGVTDITKISAALQAMAEVGMPLLVHGEVVDVTVDVFDREKEFIDRILRPLIHTYPTLKVVMEHITTEQAVCFVRDEMSDRSNIVATITAHHLLYNRSDIFKGGICPHMYCLPILKRERHRLALLAAATSGNAKFFVGTDSAPHAVETKEASCGCAGIFTGHAAIELYAEAFDSVQALDKLEGFLSIHGQQFYNIPVNTRRIRLRKEDWMVPDSYTFGTSLVRPLRAGERMTWKFEHIA